MYNVRNRLNVIWTLTMFVLGVGAGTMALSSVIASYVDPFRPTADLGVVVPPHMYRARAGFTGRSVDRAMIQVNGTLDFTPCFSWNTKQIFMYLVVEYASKKYRRSEITIYDHIITDRANAVLTLNNAIEYPTDHIEQGALTSVPAVLRVKYHLMSFTGLSPQYEIEASAVNFTFPASYYAQ
jgi:signal peptidase complex subunit 3